MSDKRQSGSAPSCKVHPHGPSNIVVTSESNLGTGDWRSGLSNLSRSLWHVLRGTSVRVLLYHRSERRILVLIPTD